MLLLHPWKLLYTKIAIDTHTRPLCNWSYCLLFNLRYCVSMPPKKRKIIQSQITLLGTVALTAESSSAPSSVRQRCDIDSWRAFAQSKWKRALSEPPEAAVKRLSCNPSHAYVRTYSRVARLPHEKWERVWSVSHIEFTCTYMPHPLKLTGCAVITFRTLFRTT